MFDLSRIWESAEAGTIEKLVDCQDDARLSGLSLSLYLSIPPVRQHACRGQQLPDHDLLFLQ
jgi:hypothetical protein